MGQLETFAQVAVHTAYCLCKRQAEHKGRHLTDDRCAVVCGTDRKSAFARIGRISVPVLFILDVGHLSPLAVLPSIPFIPLVCCFSPTGASREGSGTRMETVPWVVMVGIGQAPDHSGR